MVINWACQGHNFYIYAWLCPQLWSSWGGILFGPIHLSIHPSVHSSVTLFVCFYNLWTTGARNLKFYVWLYIGNTYISFFWSDLLLLAADTYAPQPHPHSCILPNKKKRKKFRIWSLSTPAQTHSATPLPSPAPPPPPHFF